MENTIGVQLGLGHVLEAEGSFRRELSNVQCCLCTVEQICTRYSVLGLARFAQPKQRSG